MAECRIHMGARSIFFTFGTHSWLMKETLTKQVLAPNCEVSLALHRLQLLPEKVEPLLSELCAFSSSNA